MAIIIKDDQDNEMMEIWVDNKCIFCGNTWDFEAHPQSIKQLLINCGVKNVKVEKYNFED